MGNFLLEIEASSTFSAAAPTLEILLNGVVISSELINEQTGSGARSLSYNLNYTGVAPQSLSFRFVSGTGEPGSLVALESVKINGLDVDTKRVNGRGRIAKTKLDNDVADGESVALRIKDQDVLDAFAAPVPGSPPIVSASWDPETGPARADLGTPTVTGTAGDDTISGVLFNNDVIDGAGGNDRIHGEQGDDEIMGGAGNDILVGNEGDDVIIGEDGNDNISGSEGNDQLYGNDGDDKVYGGDGDDVVSGNAGNDKLYGNDGDDTIYGGAGADKIYGQAGNNTLHGGADNDLIWGSTGDDTLYGDGGNDKLRGGGGTDTLYGGDGNDNVKGNSGNDTLYGENGDDVLAGYGGDDQLDGGIGNDKLYGHDGNDTITGGDGDDFILTHTGTDIATGGDGNDQIYAQDGNDNLSGGNDDDIINGGNGSDTLNGDAGADTVIGGAGADIINGGNGNDILHGHGIQNNEANALTIADPNILYNAQTNSFYQFVNSTVNATTAATNAAATTLNGMAGHLAVITTQAELDYLDPIANPTNDANSGSYWLNGGDFGTEGVWMWTAGAEAGSQFSQGATAVNGFLDLWAAGQPNDSDGTQDYTYIWSASDALADAPLGHGFTHHSGYLIEWEAGLMNDDNAVDTISGGDGNDWIYGYGGNDILNGDANDDQIFGGDGNDTLDGGTGNDFLNGGSGIDTADYSTSASGVTVDLNAGTATGNGTDSLTSIENVTGSSSADDISGDDGDNVLDGGDGADTLRGGNQTGISVNATTLLSYGGGQDQGGAINYMDDDVGVELDGNLWKKFLVNYTVTANTVIEFDFRSTNEAEISGIGFDNNDSIDSNATFKVYGTQNWGRTNFDNYDGSGNWTHYEINVGAFYTGTFSHLFIVNDDDGGGDFGEGYWRNIIIHEGTGESNTLVGGGDGDDLYGDNGVDTFDLDTIGTVDNIHFFNEAKDILDISDIISGFSGSIADYVQFTNSGDHVTLSVDANGATGGASFVDVAEIRGAADLDAAALYANSQIIV